VQLGSGIELKLLIGNVTTQAINSYNWSPTAGLSCVDCPAPIATPYQKQDYTVVVNYGKNCIASAGNTVRVAHGPDTYIPNAFTPNGDGTNDEFTVFGTSLKSVAMRVFNRWGEKVFDSGSDQWASWDGSYKGVIQPTGVYTYVVELVYLDGVYKVREGSITLIR
jgi:gliding motility-associated-like protein